MLIVFLAVITPSASTVTQMCQVYGNDSRYASAINVVTTPVSYTHLTYYYGNHIDIKDNLSPVIGAFTAYNLFAVCPQKYQLHTHESTAVEHPLPVSYTHLDVYKRQV